MFELRCPRPDEIPLLNALCIRSKASWGYDDAFLAACLPVLHVEPMALAQDRARGAWQRDALVGVAQISVEGTAAEVDLLFVEPAVHRAGVGRALMLWCIERARELGATSLEILSDPGARPFYERMGAIFEAMAPSDAIRGRTLPRLRLPL